MMPWLSQYVGLPFEPKGRDRDGLDCWGLVRLVLAEQYGMMLPSFVEGYSDPNDRDVVGQIMPAELSARARLVPKGDEKDGDIVLLRVAGVASHIGLLVGGGFFLHIEERLCSCLERIDSIHWRNRIEGVYRV